MLFPVARCFFFTPSPSDLFVHSYVETSFTVYPTPSRFLIVCGSISSPCSFTALSCPSIICHFLARCLPWAIRFPGQLSYSCIGYYALANLPLAFSSSSLSHSLSLTFSLRPPETHVAIHHYFTLFQIQRVRVADVSCSIFPLRFCRTPLYLAYYSLLTLLLYFTSPCFPSAHPFHVRFKSSPSACF